MSKFKPNRSFVAKFILLYGPYNALSVGKKTPKIARSPWHCVTPPEDRATAIGYMHNLVKIARVVRDIMLANRHTHRRAHYNTLPPLLQAKCKCRPTS